MSNKNDVYYKNVLQKGLNDAIRDRDRKIDTNVLYFRKDRRNNKNCVFKVSDSDAKRKGQK